jgi:hypothetical protein
MIQAKNIASRKDNFSPDEFKEKVNNFRNFKIIASAAYNNWDALQEETAKIWNSFVGDNPSCFGWADKVHPDGVYVIQCYYRFSDGTRHVYYACVESLMNDKNAFQLMKNGFDSYDKAMMAGLLLKNLTNAHREEEELTNLTAIFKLMDME